MPITNQQFAEMVARMDRNKIRDVSGLVDERDGNEASLHYKILECCRSRGWICLHGSMAHRAHRTVGEFDFVIAADRGRVFWIEAKSRSGKLRPEQAALKAWAERLGHHPVVVRSFREFLEAVS